VERLLTLTGTAPLFVSSNGAGPHPDGAPGVASPGR
jgi:hypothetical protein